MNSLIVLIFVITILMALFFTLFSFFKVVFFSVGEGVTHNFGDILLSPSISSAVPVFLSAILASVFTVVILIVGAITFIKRRKW